MFGDEGASFISSDKKETSDKFNADVDNKVKQLLDQSFIRVTKLLTEKDWELREMSKNLFWFDYLDYEEIQ
jgi:ATP-dependent Zn protease